jgi:anthranilate phosphoribosyltransferase
VSNSQLLDKLLSGNDLEEQQAYDLMQQFAAGDLDPAFAGALLAGLRAKGETAAEIRGFARAMREYGRYWW